MITREQAITLLQQLPANVKVEISIRTNVDTGIELINYEKTTGELETNEINELSKEYQHKVAYAIHKATNIPLPNNGKLALMGRKELQNWINENDPRGNINND